MKQHRTRRFNCNSLQFHLATVGRTCGYGFLTAVEMHKPEHFAIIVHARTHLLKSTTQDHVSVQLASELWGQSRRSLFDPRFLGGCRDGAHFGRAICRRWAHCGACRGCRRAQASARIHRARWRRGQAHRRPREDAHAARTHPSTSPSLNQLAIFTKTLGSRVWARTEVRVELAEIASNIGRIPLMRCTCGLEHGR